MGKCLIISGGEFEPVKQTKYDYVIACDKGYKYSIDMEILPDVVIGDFDSLTSEIPDNIPVIRLPKIKDDTDTMYAVKHALSVGYKEITICCAFGGRFDHSLSNIQTAAYILNNGGNPEIIGKDTSVYMIKDSSIELEPIENTYISVFSYSEYSSGVTLKNLKYELDNAELTDSFPVGVSNEWKSGLAKIEVKNGTLLIVISKE